jgi:transcriptional regulator with XRE-family HTH domain
MALAVRCVCVYIRDMSTIAHVRKQVLGLNQAELAALTGVSQATVSRWERGGLQPSLRELTIMRDEAKRRGKRWNDTWFFEEPKKRERAQ